MGKRIVIATLGTLGDVYPFLALGVELHAHGHEVIIATSSIHRERVEASGLTWRLMRPEMPQDDPQLFMKLFDTVSGPAYAFQHILGPSMRASYEDLLAATSKADLLVSTPLSLAGPIVALVRNIPWASAQLQPLGFLSPSDPPVPPQLSWLSRYPNILRMAAKPLCALTRKMTRSWVEPVYTLRKQLHLDEGEHPLWEGQYSPACVLAMFSPVFAPPQRDWPSQAHITGFAFYYDQKTQDEISPELAAFLRHADEPVVVTLGSAAVHAAGALYREFYEALAPFGRRIIFLTGNAENRAMLPANLPDSVLCLDYAPYEQVFPFASVVVHHGGIGTTAQALRFGKPMLIVPFTYDQPHNAERAKALDVAEVVSRKQALAKNLGPAFERVLNDAKMGERAGDLAARIVKEDGAKRASYIIESVFF